MCFRNGFEWTHDYILQIYTNMEYTNKAMINNHMFCLPDGTVTQPLTVAANAYGLAADGLIRRFYP